MKKYYPDYQAQKPNEYNEEEYQLMVNLRAEGYSYQNIADHLGRNAMGIWAKLNPNKQKALLVRRKRKNALI